MSNKNTFIRGGALALLATLAIAVAQPAMAQSALTAPATPSAYGMRADAPAPYRHHHHVQRSNLRDAYGAYSGGYLDNGVTAVPSYGYGVGDNSRNQTW